MKWMMFRGTGFSPSIHTGWLWLVIPLFLLSCRTTEQSRDMGASAAVVVESAPTAAPPPGLADHICPLGEPVAESSGKLQGKRRLALVVGVGDYLASNVPKLAGPDDDADKVYHLLTDSSTGLGLPKENVCLLKNQAATRASFKETFQKALVDRARDGDVVLLYFAGHGSQSLDGNGDEDDNRDETLMMVDARYNGEIDIVDDELNYLLSGLFRKMSGSSDAPQNVVVMLDSCNAGTATRGDESPLTPRYFEAPKATLDSKAGLPAPKSTGQRWDGSNLPGLVFVSASVDGTPANEIAGEGLFTKALIQTLRESAGIPITYSQLVLRIRQLIPSYSAMVNQKVDVQGGTFVEREVLGDSSVKRPPAYDVQEVKGSQLTLVGTALPGWSAGATVRIYAWPPGPGSSTRTLADLQDPTRAKASAVIQSLDGLGAMAQLIEGSTSEGSPKSGQGSPIVPGDLAVLAIAGKDSVTLSFRFASGKTGAVSEARKQAILSAIQANPVYRQTLQVVTTTGKQAAWTLAQASSGRLQLFDPAGALRSAYVPPTAAEEGAMVANNLHQQARQQALMQLKGEPGTDFVNVQTLQVWAEPLPPLEDLGELASICPKQNVGVWDTTKNGQGTHDLEIPLCHHWALKVKLADDAPVPLYVGGLLLSGDGALIGFPGGPDANDEPGFVQLQPGQTYTFKQSLLALPPINALDHILIFGTREDNKVEWARLREPSATRGAEGSDLQDALEDTLKGQTRAVAAVRSSKPSTWTSTHLTLKVVANSVTKATAKTTANSTGKTTGKTNAASTREYTVQAYDIREMMPANQDSGLYKLLMQTYALTNRFAENADGPRYNQDSEGRWDKLTDEQNLAKGIDCSRAIWYAFTRAGLSYTKPGGVKNKAQPEYWDLGAYVSTKEMVDTDSLRLEEVAVDVPVPASPMREHFQSCRAETELRPGDLLVYRRLKGQSRQDGHVVMVIDPANNIAWGSHAWDGAAPKGSDKVDTGVEYQWIKSIKKGLDDKWGAWDTSSMVLVDCWRHTVLDAEWTADPLNRSGSYDMSMPLAGVGAGAGGK